MPYRSKAQQGYLHANKPEIAKKFDKETPKKAYKSLPEHVKDNARSRKKKSK